MKKFLIFLFVLFVMPAFAGAFDLQQNKTFSKEQNKLAQELNNIKEDTCDLYGLVEKELSAYYGKQGIKDFYDPNHQTGWFRVYDFLSWLKAKEKDLTEKLAKEANVFNHSQYGELLEKPLKKYCSLSSSETKGFLGFFLGEKYLLSKYLKGNDSIDSYIPISKTGKAGVAEVKRQKINLPKELGLSNNNVYITLSSIKYNEESSSSFVGFLNTGLHETMHMLGILTFKTNELLSETFTIFAQLAYALPVKKEEKFYTGVRNLYNILEFAPEILQFDLFGPTEYQDSLFAYIQFKGLNKMRNLDNIVIFSKYVESHNHDPQGLRIFERLGKDFFEPLIVQKETGNILEIDQIRSDSTCKILFESDNVMIVKKDSLINCYYKSSTNRRKGVFNIVPAGVTEDRYLIEFTVDHIDIKGYVDSFAILSDYRQTFEDLANEYVKKALDSLYKESNYNKYSDIKHNPLKYFLKENKDIPPTPEGYI